MMVELKEMKRPGDAEEGEGPGAIFDDDKAE